MTGRSDRPLEDRLADYAAGENVEIEIGGEIRFIQDTYTESRAAGEKANPATPIVHETDNPTEYLTVNYQNGNYEWFEYNFRIDDGTAYLASRFKIDNPHNGRGWVPPEVKEAIQRHHPDLYVSEQEPPDWR